MSQTISVSLPSSTLYVSGSVNGVDKVWTNTEGNTWETVADKASDGKYIVALVIISSTGSTTEESFTLYYGVVALITDRTEEDRRRAEYLAALDYRDMTEEEQAEWDGELKGGYNASDLNRVESAVKYLAGVLRGLESEIRDYAKQKDVHWEEYLAPPVNAEVYPTIKNNWQITEIPTPTDMERYLNNVKLLRSATEYETDELPKDMQNLTWSGANAIERALTALDNTIIIIRNEKQTIINKTAENWFFSGEIYSGEV